MIRKHRKDPRETVEEGRPTEPAGEETRQEQPETAAAGMSGASEAMPETAASVTDPCAELNDKYLRLYSDFDNFRKRTLKEKAELFKYASEDVIKKLLPVLDDFDRALSAFQATTAADQALKEGMELIHSKFLSILQQQGLQLMRATGETFDTDFHEAVTNMPAPRPEDQGKIVDVIQKGYLLNGKVIRYAKVVVGS